MTTKQVTYPAITIQTDASSCDYDDRSLEDAIEDFADSEGWKNVKTVEDFEARLKSCGGYGWIEVDGERVADVPS